MIRTSNVKNGFIDVENVRFVSEETFHRWTRRLLPKQGDIILTREAPLGEVGKLRNNDRVFLGQRLYHFRTDVEQLDPDFLLYSFLGADLRDQVQSLGSGATVEHMRLGDLSELQILHPCICEQRRISQILSAYDTLMETNRRRIKVLDEIARSIYREWFVHFRYPGCEAVNVVDSPAGCIPETWTAKPLKELATVTYGFAFKSGRFNSTGFGQQIVRIRDIPKGRSETFTDEPAPAKYGIEDGDILVGMDGDFHMCIWADGPALQVQRVAKIRPKDNIGNLHLFLALEHPIQALNRSIVGTTVAHLGDSHLAALHLPTPPADLTRKAQLVLEPLSQEIIRLKKANRNLGSTRDLLLPRLMNPPSI